ncbi:MAG: glycosyltransferase family 9 protein [Candidatus Aminicenantes bacterium]
MSPREKQKIDPSRIRRILLIRLRRIGDVVLTTPAITTLRKGFPQAEITYVIDEPYRELVEGHPDLDRVIVLPKHLGFKEFRTHGRRIRRDRYDVVIDFHGGPRASLLTFFSRAHLKIGYKIKYKHLIYDIKLPREPEEGYFHSVENHVNLVKTLGVDPPTIPALSMAPPEEYEAANVRRMIQEDTLAKAKIIALHISAGNEFRDWGAERLGLLITLLDQIPGVKIALIGSGADKKTEKEIKRKCDAPTISMVNRLNLRELREFISHASLFVGPDSGPMHIAATTKTPIVAYFGPTLPAHFGPWKTRSTLLEKDLDCRPCRQHRCIHEDFRCLRTISPEEVYGACLPYLKD